MSLLDALFGRKIYAEGVELLTRGQIDTPDGSIVAVDNPVTKRTELSVAGAGGAFSTTANLDLYIDPVDGDDANDGLSTGAAVQSPERVNELIPRYGLFHRVRIHCAAGTYTFARRVWIDARLRGLPPEEADGNRMGHFEIIADEDWDSGVVTVLHSGTCDAGTDNDHLVPTVALTPGDWDGKIMRLTSGDCAGMYRTIRENVALSINPVESIGNVLGVSPAAGDTFEILQLNVEFDVGKGVCLIGSEAPVSVGAASYALVYDQPDLAPVGLRAYDVLRLVRLTTSETTGNGIVTVQGTLQMEGVEVEPGDDNGTMQLDITGAKLWAGDWYHLWDDDAEELNEDFLGCGISVGVDQPNDQDVIVGSGEFTGYFHRADTTGSFGHGVFGTMLGGALYNYGASFSESQGGGGVQLMGLYWGNVSIYIATAIVLSGVRCRATDVFPWWSEGIFALSGIHARSNLLQVSNGSLVAMDNTVESLEENDPFGDTYEEGLGAVELQVQTGSTLLLTSSLELGTEAEMTITVGVAAPVAKSYFDSNDYLHSIGSLMAYYQE